MLLGLPVACTSPNALPAANQHFTRDALCRGIDNSFRCARAVETTLFAASNGGASRRHDTLFIRLSNSSVRAFADEQVGGPPPRHVEPAAYTLLGGLPGTQLLLLHTQFGEGNGFTLVHTGTGRASFVEGWPLVSPDGRSVLVAESDEFNRIGVFVYELQSDSLVPVLRLEHQNWTPGLAGWTSANEAWVEQRIDNIAFPDSSRVVGKSILRRINGRWTSITS